MKILLLLCMALLSQVVFADRYMEISGKLVRVDKNNVPLSVAANSSADQSDADWASGKTEKAWAGGVELNPQQINACTDFASFFRKIAEARAQKMSRSDAYSYAGNGEPMRYLEIKQAVDNFYATATKRDMPASVFETVWKACAKRTVSLPLVGQ